MGTLSTSEDIHPDCIQGSRRFDFGPSVFGLAGVDVVGVACILCVVIDLGLVPVGGARPPPLSSTEYRPIKKEKDGTKQKQSSRPTI